MTLLHKVQSSERKAEGQGNWQSVQGHSPALPGHQPHCLQPPEPGKAKQQLRSSACGLLVANRLGRVFQRTQACIFRCSHTSLRQLQLAFLMLKGEGRKEPDNWDNCPLCSVFCALFPKVWEGTGTAEHRHSSAMSELKLWHSSGAALQQPPWGRKLARDGKDEEHFQENRNEQASQAYIRNTKNYSASSAFFV